MRNTLLGQQDYAFFGRMTTGLALWLWFSLILALAGVFYTPIFWIGFVALLAGKIYIAFSTGFIKNASREYILAGIIMLAIAIAFTASTTPTIFSGRDQGSYAAAAIHLAQSHALTFSTPASEAFFKIYGPGKALNFPGFDYTSAGELTTQFPLGYIVWLASNYALFGLLGLTIANAFTTFIFLFSLYLILRLFASRFYATWGVVIASVSLPVVWFSKMTLSENLALALFTLLALNLVLYLKEKRMVFYTSTLAIAGFFAFTRIEGFAFLAITLVMLALSPTTKNLWKSNPIISIIFPIVAFLITLVASMIANFPFYKAIAKVLWHKWDVFSGACLTNCDTDTLSLTSVFWTYGLIPIFVIGAVSALILLKRRYFLALVPLALALPTLLYLLQPSITYDHPWMLRRFAFSIFPAFLFSAVVGIALIQEFLIKKYPQSFFSKKHAYAVVLFLALFLAQLPFALQYATFSENETLLQQTRDFAKRFSKKDLVLVDRLATGDGWAMIPEPLNLLDGINAAYFFNPEDLAKLDTTGFEHVYLVVSDKEASRYMETLNSPTLTATYTFDTERLEPATDASFPRKIRTQTTGMILKVK